MRFREHGGRGDCESVRQHRARQGRGPIYNSLNLAFNKRFDTPLETLKVEFRGELYNALNHTNFTTPGGTIANSTAKDANGNPVAIQTGGTITSTFDPRIVQFGLKVLF